MAQVTLMQPFAAEFFGGRIVVEAAGANLFQLVDALDALGPGFANAADDRAGFGVDGEVCADWSTSLQPDAEVTVFALVAGGSD